MMTEQSHAPDLTRRQLAETFASWMTGSREVGEHMTASISDDRPLLATLFARLTSRSRPDIRWADLDDLLRGDPTTTVELDHPLIRGDVRRLHVLQHELQRRCLANTLLSLPPVQRAAFILIEILRLPCAEVATLMGSPESLKTAHSRATRTLAAHLEPRCEHVDPANLCRCRSRVGVALQRNFIRWPADEPHADGPVLGRHRASVTGVYRSLPPPA